MPQEPQPSPPAHPHVTPTVLFQNSNYLKLWLNGGTATTMRWLELLAIGFFTQKATDSEFLVAMMFFLRWVPMVFLGTFMGVLAERFDRRKLFLFGIATLWLVSCTLSLLAFTDTLEIWHVAVGTTINGCLNVIEFPVRRTLIGDVVKSEQLMPAMALDSVTNQCTRMAGPFLGVIIEGYVGIIGVYLMGVAMHTMGFALIWMLKPPPNPPRLEKARVFSEIADGFRHIKTRDMLVATLAVTAIMNFFAMSFSSQMPAIAVEVLKLQTDQSSFLVGAEGLGAFIGALVIASRQFTTPGRLFLFGSILFEVFILAFSHAPILMLAVPLLIIGGIGHAGFSASQSALMIAYSDPSMRARAMGAIAVCIGTQPFGILLLGLIAEAYGAPIAIAVNAALGILLLIWAAWRWPVLLQR
jgi:MFS family permease